MWPFESLARKRIWEVHAGYRDKMAFPTCWLTNVEDPDVRWNEGKPIEAELPVPLRYEVDKNLPLEDYAFTSGGTVLVSTGLCEHFLQHATCLKVYRSEIFHRGALIRADYLTLNFERSFACLDRKRSRFSRGRYSDGVSSGFLEKLVVDETKLPIPEHVFRLSEVPTYLLADEDFVAGVKEHGFTGFEFTETKVTRV